MVTTKHTAQHSNVESDTDCVCVCVCVCVLGMDGIKSQGGKI